MNFKITLDLCWRHSSYNLSDNSSDQSPDLPAQQASLQLARDRNLQMSEYPGRH